MLVYGVILLAIGAILVIVLALFKGARRFGSHHVSFGPLVLLLAVAALIAGSLFTYNWASKSTPVSANMSLAADSSAHTKVHHHKHVKVRTVSTTVRALQNLAVDPSQVASDYCNTLEAKYGGKLTLLSNDTETPFFDVGAEHLVTNDPTGIQKIATDAVNVPLVPQTIGAEQADICRDPAQAAMFMNGAGVQIVDGVTIASQNPWMQAQGPISAISQWAQSCMPRLNVTVHLACAKVMAYAATLLGQFYSPGIQQRTSWWNYRLLKAPKVGQVPTFVLNSVQEVNAQFLVIEITSKTGGCFLQLGFNMGTTTITGGDQRLAGLKCPTATALAPPAVKPTSTNSTPQHGTTTTQTTGCTSSCHPTTTTTTTGCTSSCHPTTTTTTTGCTSSCHPTTTTTTTSPPQGCTITCAPSIPLQDNGTVPSTDVQPTTGALSTQPAATTPTSQDNRTGAGATTGAGGSGTAAPDPTTSGNDDGASSSDTSSGSDTTGGDSTTVGTDTTQTATPGDTGAEGTPTSTAATAPVMPG
jgi:hypothetical protein